MSEYSFQEADKQIRDAWHVETGRNRRSMVIGWYGFRCKRDSLFESNGFRDEADYRDKVGVSRDVWGRQTRIASFFPALELDSYVAMTACNAELLAQLPEPLRYDERWLQQAASLKEEDFRRLVIAEKAAAAGVPVPEMRVTFKVKVFDGQRSVIRQALEEFRREHQIADEGTALEWLVLEYSARKTFIGFLQEQLPKLRAALDGDTPIIALRAHTIALAELLANLKGETL